MAAMLNSFQMGFKSIALQRRSGEVWDTLAKVRTEFEKFGNVLVKTQTKMEQAQKVWKPWWEFERAGSSGH